MPFALHIRRLGAALGLAWAGPLLAEPIDAECHLLWRLAALPPHLDRLADGVEGPEADALIAFEEALRGVPPTLVAEIAVSGELADHAAPLIGYALALQALRRPAAEGERAALGAAAVSPGMRSAADLIRRLLDERGCRPASPRMEGVPGPCSLRPRSRMRPPRRRSARGRGRPLAPPTPSRSRPSCCWRVLRRRFWSAPFCAGGLGRAAGIRAAHAAAGPRSSAAGKPTGP